MGLKMSAHIWRWIVKTYNKGGSPGPGREILWLLSDIALKRITQEALNFL